MSLKQNKRGMNSATIAIWLMVLLIAGIGGTYIWGQVKETALDEAKAKADAEKKTAVETAVEVSDTIKDQLISGSLRAIDKTAGVDAQASTTAYVWDQANKKTMLLNGATTSATAGTDTSVKTLIGGHIAEFVAFGNVTYYGGKLVGDKLQIQSQEIDEQGEVLEADVYALLTTPLKVTITEAGSETVLDTGDSCDNSLVNLTLSANQEDAIENFKFEVNASQKNFYFDSVIVDTPANSNIDSIKIPAMTSRKDDSTIGSVVFLKDSDNYRFVPKDGKIFLKAYQSFNTGSVQIKAGGSDVVTEDVYVYFIDAQKYKAVNGYDA